MAKKSKAKDLDEEFDDDLDEDLDEPVDEDLDEAVDEDLDEEMAGLEDDLDLDDKPAKSKSKSKAKSTAKNDEEEKPSKYRSRNDAYTGMLAISLVALLGGCALLYLDFEKYGHVIKPKIQIERIAPLDGTEGSTPAPPDGGAPPGGVPPGGMPPGGPPGGVPMPPVMP